MTSKDLNELKTIVSLLSKDGENTKQQAKIRLQAIIDKSQEVENRRVLDNE